MSKSSLRFAVLLIAILAVGALVNAWAYLGEAHVDRKPLKDFPEQMGEWRKSRPDQTLDDVAQTNARPDPGRQVGPQPQLVQPRRRRHVPAVRRRGDQCGDAGHRRAAPAAPARRR